MSKQERSPGIDLLPVISYPREAQVGQSYLMTIDIELPSLDTPWPYPEEEYPISFILHTEPYFSYEPLDGRETGVVLHRFGKTYGPARYLLTAAKEALGVGKIHITLVSGKGAIIGQIALDCVVQNEETANGAGEVTVVRKTKARRKEIQAAESEAPISVAPERSTEEEKLDRFERRLVQAGWVIQNIDDVDITASLGIAIRVSDIGILLVISGDAIGFVGADEMSIYAVYTQKPTIYQVQSSLPPTVRFPRTALPFWYESNGAEIIFTNELEPDARSHIILHFHQPATLAEWLKQAPIGRPNELNDLLRSRLRHMPPLESDDLPYYQRNAIISLEESLAANHPRTLIQMATGSGKTQMAVSSIYRLLKYGKAKRILFLVDRTIMAQQAFSEFQHYIPLDSGRRFRELYNVQLLQDNHLDPTASVCIATIQRMYTILAGAPYEREIQEDTLFEKEPSDQKKYAHTIKYNLQLPIEYFDAIIIDECHRSIYAEWRLVLDYFDAFLVGMTATLDERTVAFFNRNVVYEYTIEQAMADGLAVGCETYPLRIDSTDIGEPIEGAAIEDSLVFQRRFLNRDILAIDQIHSAITAYKNALFTELFPERKEVPKTIIFAKNNYHADDIVQVVREVFGKKDDFVAKITANAGGKLQEMINNFCYLYHPRIAVAINMLTTGVDLKAVETVVFLRSVASRSVYVQMINPARKNIKPDALRAITPDATKKKRLVVVDATGDAEIFFPDGASLNYHAHPDIIHLRFTTWLTNQQRTRTTPFTPEQITWLERIRDRIVTDLKFTEADFDRSPFTFDGGRVTARFLLGDELSAILEDLNQTLVSRSE